MLDLRTASFNDIIFEGRNKLYGAYVLRQLYERHLVRALAIAVALTLLLVTSPFIKAFLFPQLIEVPDPTVCVLPVPEVILINPPLTEPPKPVGGQVSPPPAPVMRPPAQTVPAVKADDLVKKDDKPMAPTITAIEPSVIENPGATGPSTGTGERAGLIGGTGKDSNASKTAGPPAPFITAEVMPEFMGGQEALQRYMQKNLRYPPQALRNNVEGRVYISFTVQADGSIADVQVLKGLGFGTDEEAARVVKNMPVWKPGMQNKHSVAVRYTMPITFRYD
ncbi:energy transducer TonB [Hymenobacter telluris]|nr:energy transducer TonB [Hymenobacter telluris]